jgi:hypothetical protein
MPFQRTWIPALDLGARLPSAIRTRLPESCRGPEDPRAMKTITAGTERRRDGRIRCPLCVPIRCICTGTRTRSICHLFMSVPTPWGLELMTEDNSQWNGHMAQWPMKSLIDSSVGDVSQGPNRQDSRCGGRVMQPQWSRQQRQTFAKLKLLIPSPRITRIQIPGNRC